MIPLKIACIVEGDGEIEAFQILLRRLLKVINATVFMDERIKPIVVNRQKVMKRGELERYVEIAARKVGGKGGIIILLDADDDCPAKLAPQLLKIARETRPDLPIALVMAHREYEVWFLASASSLKGKHGLSNTFEAPVNLESKRGAKEWLSKYMPEANPYDPMIHQLLLTREIDIELARESSPSFDKLYRDLQAMILQLQEMQTLLPGN